MSANHPACLVTMVPGIQRCTSQCVCATCTKVGLLADSFDRACALCRIFAAAMCIRSGLVVLLADRLQRVQSAFNVADLRSQSVYGLHGTIQLLTASHQCVHALWEPECNAGDEKAAAKLQVDAMMEIQQEYRLCWGVHCDPDVRF